MQPPAPLVAVPPTNPLVSATALPIHSTAVELPPVNMAKTHQTGVDLILATHNRQDQELEAAWKKSQDKIEGVHAQFRAFTASNNLSPDQLALLESMGRKANVEIPTTTLQGTQVYIDAKARMRDDTIERLHKMDDHAIESCAKVAEVAFDAQERADQLHHNRKMGEIAEERAHLETLQKRTEVEHKEAERSAKALEENRHQAIKNKIEEDNARLRP